MECVQYVVYMHGMCTVCGVHAWNVYSMWCTCMECVQYVVYMHGMCTVCGVHAWNVYSMWCTCMECEQYVVYMHGMCTVCGVHAWNIYSMWCTCMECVQYVVYMHGMCTVCGVHAWNVYVPEYLVNASVLSVLYKSCIVIAVVTAPHTQSIHHCHGYAQRHLCVQDEEGGWKGDCREGLGL